VELTWHPAAKGLDRRATSCPHGAIGVCSSGAREADVAPSLLTWRLQAGLLERRVELTWRPCPLPPTALPQPSNPAYSLPIIVSSLCDGVAALAGLLSVPASRLSYGGLDSKQRHRTRARRHQTPDIIIYKLIYLLWLPFAWSFRQLSSPRTCGRESGPRTDRRGRRAR